MRQYASWFINNYHVVVYVNDWELMGGKVSAIGYIDSNMIGICNLLFGVFSGRIVNSHMPCLNMLLPRAAADFGVALC